MATLSSLNNSWRKLYATANSMKLPDREVLTKEGVYSRKRPEPEVVEHMLDDLETKMRNYFILYNREREFRKKSEENCYRLEQELLGYQQKLEEANNKFHCLERKVKSMVEQPLKLKETIDRIDLLYNQMDTLIQAFVGIGSCAVIQGYSRVAFIKLCLEYLYPCRELDVRLNTLYNALYNVLTQYDGIEVTKNEVLKPMTFHDPPEKATLTGLSVKVHRLMLKCDLPNPDTKTFGCFFRYDNESKDLKDVDKSRYVSVDVKPMDNASKVYEFNLVAENNKLPPKVPNVVPKLVLDVYADNVHVGSAEAALISDRTLKPSEPWNVLDANGVNCGDVVVTVLPMPENAKLPAVNFTNKTDELMVKPNQTVQAPVEPVKPQDEPKPVVEEKPKVEPSKPAADGNKAFQPKSTPNVRKPLFNPRTSAAKPAAAPKDKPQPNKAGASNVSRLSLMFSGKKNNAEKEPEVPKLDSLPERVDSKTEAQKEKTNIKDLIIKKLSSRFGSKEHLKDNNDQQNQGKAGEEAKEEGVLKALQSKQEEVNVEPKVETNLTTQKSLEKLPSKKVESKKFEEVKPVEETKQEEKVEKQEVVPEPPKKQESLKKTKPVVEKLPTKPVPPPVAPKTVPAVPVKAPLPEPAKPAAETLPDKPLLPIVIAPKMLKKAPTPKKN